MKKFTLLSLFVSTGVIAMSQTAVKQVTKENTSEKVVLVKKATTSEKLTTASTAKGSNEKAAIRDDKNANAKGTLQNLLAEPVTTETKVKQTTKLD